MEGLRALGAADAEYHGWAKQGGLAFCWAVKCTRSGSRLAVPAGGAQVGVQLVFGGDGAHHNPLGYLPEHETEDWLFMLQAPTASFGVTHPPPSTVPSDPDMPGHRQ